MIEKVLVIDDDKEMGAMLQRHLTKSGLDVTVCSSAEDGLVALRGNDFALVITDLKMTGMNGIEVCDRISGNYPDLPVLILTAFGTLDTAVEAIRAGAYDFLVKPVNLDSLTVTVDRAIRNSAARRKLKQLAVEPSPALDTFEEQLLGESRHIAETRALIQQIANFDTSLLITGESGTGKELVAKVLHHASKRKNAPFVVVNCATMSEASAEEELFGRSPGEDGDGHAKPGLVATASNGTLYFDDVVSLPLPVQSKLLRLLEERMFRPVGGQDEIACTARFVFATNQNLDTVVTEGNFREDLFFRMNVIHLKLQPLRERGNDVLILAHHFLSYFAKRMGKEIRGISEPVAGKLVSYGWPGNVRELRNTIERAVALAKNDHLVVDDLPDEIQRFKSLPLFRQGGKEDLVPIDEVEQRHILTVLREVGGNKALAAKVLGMDRKTLYRKLERYGYQEEFRR